MTYPDIIDDIAGWVPAYTSRRPRQMAINFVQEGDKYRVEVGEMIEGEFHKGATLVQAQDIPPNTTMQQVAHGVTEPMGLSARAIDQCIDGELYLPNLR